MGITLRQIGEHDENEPLLAHEFIFDGKSAGNNSPLSGMDRDDLAECFQAIHS